MKLKHNDYYKYYYMVIITRCSDYYHVICHNHDNVSILFIINITIILTPVSSHFCSSFEAGISKRSNKRENLEIFENLS